MNYKILIAAFVLSTGAGHTVLAQQSNAMIAKKVGVETSSLSKGIEKYEKSTNAAESEQILDQLKQEMMQTMGKKKETLANVINTGDKEKSHKIREQLNEMGQQYNKIVELSKAQSSKKEVVGALKAFNAL